MNHTNESLTHRLAGMHELQFELATAGSIDALCRTAVERGRVYTGIDRLGIWFIDPDDPQWFTGSFGIDERGGIRDERESRIRRDPRIYDEDFFERRIPFRFLKDSPVFDNTTTVVGRGDLIVAPMWNGTVSIGALSADTFLSGRPMSEDDQQLIALLARMLGHLVTIKRTEKQLRDSARELERLATTDGLTNLYNRRTGLEFLDHQINLAQRTMVPLTIAYIDLNRLKMVNDMHGHQKGDAFIVTIAQLIRSVIRDADIACRMGGDEFMIVFPMSTREQAVSVIHRLSDHAKRSSELLAIVPGPWFSIGFAQYDPHQTDARLTDDARSIAERLIHRSDQEMYADKRSCEDDHSSVGR